MDEDIYNTPILVEDACSMLRRKISKNEKPYTVEIIKYNNDLVNEWKRVILENVCHPDGKIASGKIPNMWITFEEGKTIGKYMDLKKEGLLQEYPMKTVLFWRDFFENLSVTEMREYGWGIVANGWKYLNSYVLDYFIIKKWETLYSKSEDPLYWEKNSFLVSDFSKGKPHPFWDEELLKDIQQKVDTIISNPVKPSY